MAMLNNITFTSPPPSTYTFAGGFTGVTTILPLNTPVYRGQSACQYVVHLPNGVIRIWDYNTLGHPSSLASKAKEVLQFERLVAITRNRDNRRAHEQQVQLQREYGWHTLQYGYQSC